MLAEHCSRCFQSSGQSVGFTIAHHTSLRPGFSKFYCVIYHRTSTLHPIRPLLNQFLKNPKAICADLAAMLLSNLTASSPACSALLTMKIAVIPHQGSLYPVNSRSGSCAAPVPYPAGEEKEVPALPLLVEAFVQGATMGEITDLSKRPRKAELHFLASVFANMSVVRLQFIRRKYYWLSYRASSHRQGGTFSSLHNRSNSPNKRAGTSGILSPRSWPLQSIRMLSDAKVSLRR